MAIEHKPLIEYLPPFLAEYREYRRIMDVLWDEISAGNNSILKRVDEALENTFIADADAAGVKRWEQMLNIVPDAGATLDERKEAVRVKMAGRRPFTMRKLEEILEQLTGPGEYLVTMAGPYSMTIRLAITSAYKMGAVDQLVSTILPANIALTIDLMYHQHQEYFGLTHNGLTEYTHHELREELIDE